VNAIVESCLQGVSTRKVQEIVSYPWIDHLSPVSVSRMARGLDDQAQAFLLRSIEHTISYLFVDASYYKVRDGACYVTRAVLMVAGRSVNGGILFPRSGGIIPPTCLHNSIHIIPAGCERRAPVSAVLSGGNCPL